MESNQLQNCISISDMPKITPSSKKCVTIYYFLDPFCNTCWTTDSAITKLQLEYGMYFTVRPIIFTTQKQSPYNMSKQEHYHLFLAMKAAALQGSRAHYRFVRCIKEMLYLQKNKRRTINQLICRAAQFAKLDLEAFKSDFSSKSVIRALQCDEKLQKEMMITHCPTLVFFSQYNEEHSLKVVGAQSYDTYIYLLEKMINDTIMPNEKPSLEDFFIQNGIVTSRDIAFIYDQPLTQVEKELKQLQLMQKIKKVKVNDTYIWKGTHL